MFEHGTGILHRHFAGQERGHFLYRRGISGAFFQAQGGVGWQAPFAATPAVTTGAFDGDRAVAALKGEWLIGRQAGELLLANRTKWWGGVGLGLGTTLNARPQEVLDIAGRLNFEVTKILIFGQRA